MASSPRFLIVTGKGGVGKTTVSATLARRFEAEGKRVLVALCNAKDRMSPLLGSAPLTPQVQRVSAGIDAVNMHPDQAIEEYGLLTLKSRALYKILFDNRYVRTFLRAVPGMQEWSLLGKAWWHTTERDERGNLKYDVVILDAPATGHGLDMLRVPKVIVEVVPPGLLRRDAEAALTLFRDPEQAGVVLVTLPEEMPTQESVELLAAIRGELGLPVARIVVNAALAPLFSENERRVLAGNSTSNETPEGAVLRAGKLRALREGLQGQCIERLQRESQNPDGSAVPLTILPQLLHDASRPEAIAALQRAFD